jgi:hypothetical protein
MPYYKRNVIKKAKPSKDARIWEYKLGTGRYSFSLSALEKDYKRFSKMRRSNFLKNLKDITHFACIMSYYNDLTPEQTVADEGIVHELIHLSAFFDSTDTRIWSNLFIKG